MTATNSATTFLTCFSRRWKIRNDYFDVFVQYSYYILLGAFYLWQVFLDCVVKCHMKHREREMSMSELEISKMSSSHTFRLQSYCWCAAKMVSTMFWAFAMPLWWTDQSLKWIIQKIITINMDTLVEEAS